MSVSAPAFPCPPKMIVPVSIGTRPTSALKSRFARAIRPEQRDTMSATQVEIEVMHAREHDDRPPSDP